MKVVHTWTLGVMAKCASAQHPITPTSFPPPETPNTHALTAALGATTLAPTTAQTRRHPLGLDS